MSKIRWFRKPELVYVGMGLTAVTMVAATHASEPRGATTPYVAFAANDLGMHCMQQDFSDLMILPPYNTVHVQVIDRSGDEPHIIEENLDIRFHIPGNTRSADKTNFWVHDLALLGIDLPPDIGLTGTGMSGSFARVDGSNDWSVIGIPITPIDDDGRENPYPLAVIDVYQGGVLKAQTQTVVPVSWEINCNLCHVTPDISTGLDIIRAHDRLHGTDLESQTPVFCAACHADPALAAPGQPGLPSFSAAMHGAHADRMGGVDLVENCYACHPGVRTQCQRDIHLSNGITCTQCHGGMEAVANPARTPWVDEPRCADCHTRAGFEFEQPGMLFRDSRGHGGVACYACHGSPHAITPAVTETDNIQAILQQGHSGVISECSVCHSRPPEDSFFHRRED